MAEAGVASAGAGPWEWLAGVFYLGTQGDFDVSADARTGLVRRDAPRIRLDQTFVFEEHGAAVYGHLARRFGDRFQVDAGLRYSHDGKTRGLRSDEVLLPLPRPLLDVRVLVPIDEIDSDDWGRISGTLGVEARLSDEHLLYGKFSTGYKSGTVATTLVNVGTDLRDIEVEGDVAVLGTAFRPANTRPEDILAWEIGAKTDWLDRRLRANLAAFLYLYDDLQVSQLVGASVFLENAAEARTVGAELELTALVSDQLLLTGSFAYLDARFTDFDGCRGAEDPTVAFDCTGNRMLRAPRLSGTTSAQVELDLGRLGSLVPRIQIHASDEVFLRALNLEGDRQEPYWLLDLRLSWLAVDGWLRVESFVHNVLDEDVVTTRIVGTALQGAPITASFDRPRTAGVRIGMRW